MRLLKNILIGTIVLSAIIFLVSLLFPSTVTVTRDITIRTNSHDLAEQIKVPVNWQNWYQPFTYADSVLKITDAGASAIKWKTANDDAYAINLLVIDSSLIEARFMKADALMMTGRFLISMERSDGIVRLQWKSLMKLGWMPWEKFSGIVAEDMIAPQMELSLDNLKRHLESKAALQ